MKHFISLLLFCLPTLLCAQTIDSTVIKQVDSLLQVSRKLAGQRQFEQALAVNDEAERLALAHLGRESAVYGKCCNSRGVVFYFKGDYTNAEKWYLDAKDIWEKTLGKEHAQYSNILNNLGSLYIDMGQYEKAETLLLESKAIRGKVWGNEHPEYANSLMNLAILYYNMGQYEKAEPFYLEAKDIRGKTLGNEHPEYANSLNNLAVLYHDMGQYEKAEPFYLEAKDIKEKALGKEHPSYAGNLMNLGILYTDMGQYEKVETLHLEAIKIQEKVLGKEHPDYATGLMHLAILYLKMGQYEKAEPLVLEAKDIREKAFGKEHPDYAYSLMNLANLYHNMGQNEKAETLYLEAKDIWGKTLGKEHPDYASSLNNLANLYREIGQYEKVEPLYLEAIEIRGKVLGKEHPEYALSLNNLAALYGKMHQYEKAETLLLEAKDIWGKTFGKEHPDYAYSLNNLASLYGNMGQHEKAETLYLEAKDILEKVLGKEHPRYANRLANLAILYMDMGQYEKAETLYLELSSSNKRLLEKASLHLSEQELHIYLNTFSASQNSTLLFTQTTGSKILIPTCYDNSLFYKGFLLQSAGRIRQLALSDTAATENFNRLIGYQRRLAALYAMPIAERDSALVAQLETQANDLEKELARTVAGYSQTKRQVSWQEVQAGLKPGEAAVEFVHYRLNDSKSSDSTFYAALVLHPGLKQPAFIHLFEEKQLVQLLSQNQHGQNIAQVYAGRGASPLKTGNDLIGLYELLWRPLKKHLKGKKVVFYSPSGLLHRINFDAIPMNDKQILSDRFRLRRLTSNRSLVVQDLTKTDTANAAILFGGISYNSDSTAMSQANAALDPFAIASRGQLSFNSTDSTLRVGTWSDLYYTAKEVESLSGILKSGGTQVHTYRGYAATEEAFKSIGSGGKSSPRVLHLATHGYFFPDPKSAVSGERVSSEREPIFKMSDHPMIRSGLLLAGANHAWATGKPLREGMEDGILTAYEISQMNLSNTELVVLSACETGLGDIQGNEGVYGLQRAFKIAGAKYLVMSLWQVPDQETSVFMTSFYRLWLEGNMSIPDAFRTTQQEMRERFINPYSWAGFVLVE